jgi:hypothetical protein
MQEAVAHRPPPQLVDKGFSTAEREDNRPGIFLQKMMAHTGCEGQFELLLLDLAKNINLPPRMHDSS